MKKNVEEIRLQTFEKYKKHINPSLARLFKMTGCDRVEWKSRGSIIQDMQGNKFIDCLGSYGVFNAGHSHPKVIAAVRDQLRRMPLASKVFLNKPMADLAERLAQITPGDLQYSFICNSGTEAVEGAIKLAKAYTKRAKVVSCTNAFHGKTLGALSASGRDIYKQPFQPLLPEFVQVPFNDLAAAENEVDEKTAAVIIEPVQGEGGVVVPDPDYLPSVEALCRKNGAVLILDEVQTGFGRCGELFACEHFKVQPDILVLAKALGGGVMPIGAFVAKPEVWQPFIPNPLLHTTTFGGNPLACAAALASIDVIIKEKLPEKAKQKGSYFLQKFSSLQKEHPEVIRSVRGLGLLIGMELTREAFGGILLPEMIKRRVLIAYTLNNPKVIRFEPPLTITDREKETVLTAFKESLVKASGVADKL